MTDDHAATQAQAAIYSVAEALAGNDDPVEHLHAARVYVLNRLCETHPDAVEACCAMVHADLWGQQ